MSDWIKSQLSAGATLGDALAVIDAAALGVAIVLDDDSHLVGLVTDGDVRRALIGGSTLDAPVLVAMNASPITVAAGASREEILALMRVSTVHQIPQIADDGRVVGLATIDELTGVDTTETGVLILAGGLGTRLRPLTDDLPKPLLEVNGKAILEVMLEHLAEQGFRMIMIAVNYHAEMIRERIGDGSRWGVHIDYIEEREALGTAGALGLLDPIPEHPMLVLNGDLVTKADLRAITADHVESSADMTVTVREHVTGVEYGVIDIDEDHNVVAINEKPQMRHLVSAGIYVVSPSVVGLVDPGQPIQMPDLINRVLISGMRVCSHLSDDFWIDIGRIDQLERARREWF